MRKRQALSPGRVVAQAREYSSERPQLSPDKPRLLETRQRGCRGDRGAGKGTWQNKKSKSRQEENMEKLTSAALPFGNEKAKTPWWSLCFEDGVRAGTRASSVQCCAPPAEVGMQGRVKAGGGQP